MPKPDRAELAEMAKWAAKLEDEVKYCEIAYVCGEDSERIISRIAELLREMADAEA
jgi:hypothetical protein